MKLDIYRIDTSIVGKIFSKFRKPDLPALVGAAALAHIGDAPRAFRDYVIDDNLYILSREEEIDRFEFPTGDRWRKKQYYIRHPKKEKGNHLIEADKFFEYIYRNQLAEIIDYIRAYTDVSYIMIERKEGVGFDAFTSFPIEGIPFVGKAKIRSTKRDLLEIECEGKLKPSEQRRNFVWIDEFPGIIQIVDSFNGGEATRIIEKDNSFQMSSKVADYIGVGTKWIKNYKLEVKIKG